MNDREDKKKCSDRSVVCLLSQDILYDWIEERHVFGALDWQFADSVILDHLRNADERLAELAKDVLALAIYYDLHVHKTTGTPESNHS